MKKRNLSPEAKARKAAYDAAWRAKNREYQQARKEYFKGYYDENREQLLANQREYAKNNPRKKTERDLEREKERCRERRREILELLGSKCERCGIDDWRVLQIHHINGGGRKDRKTISGYSRLKKDIIEHGRSKYQVLCANCHALKIYEGE